MKKRWLMGGVCFCLAVSMMFSGCSKKQETEKKTVKLETGEITEDSIIMSIGQTAVKYSEVKNYAYLLKCQYERDFGAKLWKYPVGDLTIGDEAKQEVINMITQMKVIKRTAQEQKIELTADEKDEAVQRAEEIVGGASEKEKEEYCLSIQRMTELYEENILANKMFYIATDEAETDISDEEALQISIQYLEIITKGIDANGVEISMDDSTKAQALKRIKKLRKSITDGADFLETAQNNTDADQTECIIGKDTTMFPPEAIEVAFTLTKGQMSRVIEAENAYYLIYCVEDKEEDATYTRKEEIIEERQTALFKEKYEKWLQEDVVSISDKFWEVFQL